MLMKMPTELIFSTQPTFPSNLISMYWKLSLLEFIMDLRKLKKGRYIRFHHSYYYSRFSLPNV